MENQQNNEEERLQAECFQWHWGTFPQLRRTVFHVQQKARNKIEGSRFKAIGVVKGPSDLIMICPKKTIYIEMKTETGTQSEEQKDFQRQVEEFGCQEYYICRSLEYFKELTYKHQFGIDYEPSGTY